MFVELCNSLSDRGNIVPIGDIQPVPTPHDRYITLFPFDQTIKEWVKTHINDKGRPTVKGHSGLHYLPYLAIDIDNGDNVEQARDSCLKLIKRLFEAYSLSSDDIRVFFSGNKGFHVIIRDKTIGCPPPSQNIAETCKAFVSEIADGIPSIDLAIYENHRLFRVENSLNEKSGLYKYQLSFAELEKYSVEDIKRRGKIPRTDFKAPKKYQDILPNEKLISVWQRVKLDKGQKDRPSYSEGFFTPPVKSERNNKLFAQAAMLFDKSVFNEKAVLELIRNANNAGIEPLEDSEVRAIVSSARSKTKNNPIPLELTNEDIVIKSIGEWSKEWYENLLPQENELTLGFPKFDLEMRGRLRGKLGVVLGYGGSKKSLYVKNIAKHNSEKNFRTIYSMMEMGIGDTINRFVDMKVDGHTENATYALERIERTQKGEALRIFSEKIAPEYSDKILLSFNNSMTCEKYDEVIGRVIKETGHADILIVDGLSMMGGDKNETERYSQNSKALKDIANKYNMLVLLICHASKGADKHTRDLSKNIRSSEKIIDNCDFYINFSLLIDGSRSTNEITEYRQDKGYARLVNKRGSGNSANIIFDFQSTILHLVETQERPEDYEIKRKQKTAIDDL